MKIQAFIIFISIVLVFYSAVNYYIFIRGLHALPAGKAWSIGYIILFIVLFASYIIGRAGTSFLPLKISEFFMLAGSFWMAFMLYFFLIVLFFDVIKGIERFTGFLPEFITSNIGKTKHFILFISVISVSLLVLIGHINSRIIHVRTIDLVIDKAVEGRNELQVAMFSDLHLGHLIKRNHLAKIVTKINEADPDLVLLAGDIFDENPQIVINEHMGREFLKLQASLGVIGVTGNHEYIGNAEIACRYLEECGIKMLRDSSVLIDNSFYIIGREDRDKTRFSGQKRKEVSELVADLNSAKPLILIDHQPYEFKEKEAAGIDLSLSGHTHHGQFFPINLITKAIFELSWGYLKKGNTHFYTSCGVGGWGPPVRLGNRPEIVIFNIKFAS
ncbi:metallophosphoesterase [Bacteroidota bacterium]